MFGPKPAKVYYWNTVPNFGDAMAPLLLSRFGDRESEWEPISRANVVITGSVLEHIPPLWDGHVLGAGKLYEDSRLYLYTHTATIWAVRGPLTARQMTPGDYALGDPGLLADELVTVKTRDIDLGVVPHHTDHTLAEDPQWFSKDWTTTVIDPRGKPLEVIAAIGRCRKIVSSSLHGIITADAFGIPRRYEPNKEASRHEGGYFKFWDYSASIHTPFVPNKVIEASRFHVEDCKFQLYDAFRSMSCVLS